MSTGKVNEISTREGQDLIANRESSKTWPRVWDPVVRLGHWLLVVAFFTAYLTEEELLNLHVWAGYAVGIIVVVRIVWGFVGPQRARFTDFVRGPRATFSYLFDLISGSARRHVGHSPAGGAMVLALLFSLAVTTWSGLWVYAYEEQAGPIAGFVTTPAITSSENVMGLERNEDLEHPGELHDESESRYEKREEWWEETHEFFANLTLFLVLLHVAGVALASFVHRENLASAMITGRKRPL